jgi:hypothetical protein
VPCVEGTSVFGSGADDVPELDGPPMVLAGAGAATAM